MASSAHKYVTKAYHPGRDEVHPQMCNGQTMFQAVTHNRITTPNTSQWSVEFSQFQTIGGKPIFAAGSNRLAPIGRRGAGAMLHTLSLHHKDRPL